jgi:hypothetical protein
MGDISKEEYERLDLRDSLSYRDVATMACATQGCEFQGIEREVDSEKAPFDFIYAKELDDKGNELTKYMPLKRTCTSCMFRLEEVSVEYFKRAEESKFSVNVTKAKGDRGKNYYRDFSKQSWKQDPEAGKNATELSKKDIQKLKNL